MMLRHTVVLVLLSSMAFAAEPPPVPVANEIAAFATDGCSVWPSGDWRDCCTLHDFAHWKGGTAKEKFRSDIELFKCVLHSGDGWLRHLANAPLAGLMLIGGSLGGLAEFPTTVRWGYGWKYDRGYEGLTPELQKLVDEKTPPDILAILPSVLHDNSKPYPSETGNYCLDELLRLFTAYAQERDIPVTMSYERTKGPADSWVAYQATLNSSLCKDSEYTAIFQAHTDELCTEPTSRDDPTRYFRGFFRMDSNCPDFNAWYRHSGGSR